MNYLMIDIKKMMVPNKNNINKIIEKWNQLNSIEEEDEDSEGEELTDQVVEDLVISEEENE